MNAPAHDARRFALSIVIPAYNEADRITATLQRVLQRAEAAAWNWEVLVVDDGSTDGTGEIVSRLFRDVRAVRLIRNAVNSGKGFAVRQGMLEARGEYLLFSDADLSTPIEETERLMEALRAGYDVAIGSRALKPEWVHPRQPWARQTAGKMFNLFVRALTSLPYRDTQCGFKAFRREAAQAIFAQMTIPGFGFDVEILYIARKLGYRVKEVPVHWANDARTKVRPFRDGLRMLGDLLRIRRNDRAGRYVRQESGVRSQEPE